MAAESRYTSAIAFAAEGARCGLVVCKKCGVALLLSMVEDSMKIHDEWHATAADEQGGVPSGATHAAIRRVMREMECEPDVSGQFCETCGSHSGAWIDGECETAKVYALAAREDVAETVRRAQAVAWDEGYVSACADHGGHASCGLTFAANPHGRRDQ